MFPRYQVGSLEWCSIQNNHKCIHNIIRLVLIFHYMLLGTCRPSQQCWYTFEHNICSIKKQEGQLYVHVNVGKLATIN